MGYTYNRTAGLAVNALTQYPNRRWGFAGKVDGRLMYETKDGKAPTEDQLLEIRQSSNPGMMQRILGIKSRAWDTALEACLAAKKLNLPVYVNEGILEANPGLAESLDRANVKYKS
jgi:hypothetical protein